VRNTSLARIARHEPTSPGMNTRPPASIVHAAALGLLIANLAIICGTIFLDFIPSRLTLLLGVAYGAACAACYVGAAGFAEARLPQLSEYRRRRLGGFLTTRVIGAIAMVQLGLGTAAFISGIAGVSTWMFGSEVKVAYTVRESRGTSLHAAATRLFLHREACGTQELGELTKWQNAFGPCLDQTLAPGARIAVRGESSALGLRFMSIAVEAAGKPQLAQTLVP
jgi:hypothetical protein